MSGEKKIFRKKDGFSLVELMIVIGIMAVLVGLTALGFGYFGSAAAKEATHGINSGLSDLRSETMAKSQKVYMHLNRYNGDYYVTYTDSDSFTPDGTGKKIGDSRVTITCAGTEMADNTDICFSMRKKDGAFTHGPFAASGITTISVVADNGSNYDVKVVKDTGRHYIEHHAAG